MIERGILESFLRSGVRRLDSAWEGAGLTAGVVRELEYKSKRRRGASFEDQVDW